MGLDDGDSMQPSSSVLIRVKAVPEINQNPSEFEAPHSSTTKRKCPEEDASLEPNSPSDPKRNKSNDEPVGEGENSSVVVKQEPLDEPASSTSSEDSVPVKVKDEPADNASSSCSPSTTVKEEKITKEEATSTTRDVCKFGIRCYRRRNPYHTAEMAHPGDSDYKRPDFPEPPLGTPECPFGNRCYRRNPTHFEQFSHPPSTDSKKNLKDRLRKLKAKKENTLNDLDFSDVEEEDDPFMSDESEDEFMLSLLDDLSDSCDEDSFEEYSEKD